MPEPDQKKWITDVVKQLGSIDKVKELYTKDCPVDKWANALAMQLFEVKKRRSKCIN